MNKKRISLGRYLYVLIFVALFIVYYLKGGWMKRCQERLVTKAQG